MAPGDLIQAAGVEFLVADTPTYLAYEAAAEQSFGAAAAALSPKRRNAAQRKAAKKFEQKRREPKDDPLAEYHPQVRPFYAPTRARPRSAFVLP